MVSLLSTLARPRNRKKNSKPPSPRNSIEKQAGRARVEKTRD